MSPPSSAPPPSCPSLCSSPTSAPSPGFSASPAQRRSSFTPSAGTVPAALDHDHYKAGSITPSVMLMGTIPEDAGDSWYGGQVYVDLRDS
eukprot:6055578-Prymnesium_polylepis.1